MLAHFFFGHFYITVVLFTMCVYNVCFGKCQSKWKKLFTIVAQFILK